MQLAMETPVVAGANGDADRAAQRAAFASSIQELRRRVAAEPGVAGVTFADWLPRVPDRPWDRIELPDDVTVTPRRRSRRGRRGPTAAPMGERRRVSSRRTSTSLETPILAGRAFGCRRSRARCECRDRRSGLRGAGAAGAESHRAAGAIRARSEAIPPSSAPNPWIEIVGVVKELGMGSPLAKGRAAGLYLPATPDRFDRVLHDGARSGRSDDAGPTGSRDRGRRGPDAPPGGVAAGGPGPGRHSVVRRAVDANHDR